MDVVDGNAIGGLLHEVFGTEMTGAATVCGSCGAARQVAELVVYQHGRPLPVVRQRADGLRQDPRPDLRGSSGLSRPRLASACGLRLRPRHAGHGLLLRARSPTRARRSARDDAMAARTCSPPTGPAPRSPRAPPASSPWSRSNQTQPRHSRSRSAARQRRPSRSAVPCRPGCASYLQMMRDGWLSMVNVTVVPGATLVPALGL